MAVHVAVGVIINENNEVLIARRSANQHQGDKWEFPGGKVETGEESQSALKRELHEELGIEASHPQPFTQITHQYQDKDVFLDVFLVKKWGGVPYGQEGQPLRWVHLSELKQYIFPAANIEILEKIATL